MASKIRVYIYLHFAIKVKLQALIITFFFLLFFAQLVSLYSEYAIAVSFQENMTVFEGCYEVDIYGKFGIQFKHPKNLVLLQQASIIYVKGKAFSNDTITLTDRQDG